jgi:hypothetical protein
MEKNAPLELITPEEPEGVESENGSLSRSQDLDELQPFQPGLSAIIYRKRILEEFTKEFVSD